MNQNVKQLDEQNPLALICVTAHLLSTPVLLKIVCDTKYNYCVHCV